MKCARGCALGYGEGAAGVHTQPFTEAGIAAVSRKGTISFIVFWTEPVLDYCMNLMRYF